MQEVLMVVGFGGMAVLGIVGLPLLRKACSISYSWVVVVYSCTALMLVITNAQHLNDEVRGQVVLGSTFLCAIFLIFRGLERLLRAGATPDIKLRKGDASASLTLSKKALERSAEDEQDRRN